MALSLFELESHNAQEIIFCESPHVNVFIDE